MDLIVVDCNLVVHVGSFDYAKANKGYFAESYQSALNNWAVEKSDLKKHNTWIGSYEQYLQKRLQRSVQSSSSLPSTANATNNNSDSIASRRGKQNPNKRKTEEERNKTGKKSDKQKKRRKSSKNKGKQREELSDSETSTASEDMHAYLEPDADGFHIEGEQEGRILENGFLPNGVHSLPPLKNRESIYYFHTNEEFVFHHVPVVTENGVLEETLKINIMFHNRLVAIIILIYFLQSH